jgi:hypothetical protein
VYSASKSEAAFFAMTLYFIGYDTAFYWQRICIPRYDTRFFATHHVRHCERSAAIHNAADLTSNPWIASLRSQ